ncbi:molecular chaperone GroEL [Candidatus Methylospira mobilis]|uniref:60 kDa chaperonin n=1 Tax=Candidatus Methylospira mobilis TaxID=1808979 RepID=A0A5Q0BHM9_9GAMM|nr:molecular chaperone GroEL [Candidatus Methylospira mobilis]QFY43059.1 molecular chaperone GroEL [Candidatus Methylospira mobilis]WNV03800.1 molecular chaperone GroEL [Candidatus Methylospira mobilis]
MAKQIVFNHNARSRMMRGINKLAQAVEVTLGASGPSVVIQHRTDGVGPVVTRDGVTVAQAITLPDIIEDVGARMLRDVAGAVSRAAGDGTTTSIVLARSLARGCEKSMVAGANPVDLKKGMELAVECLSNEMRRTAIRTQDRDIFRKVCRSASKEDDSVADLLIDAIEAVGNDGVVSFELGYTHDDELEITDGSRFAQGYLSSYFNTDKERNLAELDQPYILLYDREVTDFMDLVPLLENAQDQRRPLLVIAENITEEALAPLLLNHVRGNFKVVAVKPPGFGDGRSERLLDLAIMTGGRACLEVQGDTLEKMTLADLGQAQRVVVSAESTLIIGCRGDAQRIEDRIAQLTLDADRIRARKPGEGSPTGNRHDLENLEERIAFLRSKTAVYRVGGLNDMTIKERMVRVENAYNSVRAAMDEGVMAGGGVGLLHIRRALDRLRFDNADLRRGVEIVEEALYEPLRCIAHNAGMNPESVLAKVLMHDDGVYGYDVAARTYGSLLEAGILDPVKVARLALQNAAGIVSTVMTTEAIVCQEPVLKRFPNTAQIAEWAAATREDPRAP